ncbi:MAG TPA: transposase, partial [Blastocatellia bacterium]
MAEDKVPVKTFEFRIRDNKPFTAACERALSDSRFVYNCALEQRIIYYRNMGKGTDLNRQSRELTEARKEIPELSDRLRAIQQDALERLDLAFDAFFRRLRNGETPGFPRFKSKER